MPEMLFCMFRKKCWRVFKLGTSSFKQSTFPGWSHFVPMTCIGFEQQNNMVTATNEGMDLMLVFISKFSTENGEVDEDFSEEEGEQRKSTVSLKKVHPC